MAEISKMG